MMHFVSVLLHITSFGIIQNRYESSCEISKTIRQNVSICPGNSYEVNNVFYIHDNFYKCHDLAHEYNSTAIMLSEPLWGYRHVDNDLFIKIDDMFITENTKYVEILPDQTPSVLSKLDAVLHTLAIILVSYLFITLLRERLKQYKKNKTLPISKYIVNDTTDTCSICLDDFKQDEIIRTTPCKHVYHKECLDKWTLNKKETKCPNCNQELHV